MPMTARQSRGRETQHIVARWFREHGFTYAAAIVGGKAGRDIENMPGLAPECKATAKYPGPIALRQAKGNANGDLPFVIWRQNGQGPNVIHDWSVIIRLSDFTELIRDAGYGEPPDVPLGQKIDRFVADVIALEEGHE